MIISQSLEIRIWKHLGAPLPFAPQLPHFGGAGLDLYHSLKALEVEEKRSQNLNNLTLVVTEKLFVNRKHLKKCPTLRKISRIFTVATI